VCVSDVKYDSNQMERPKFGGARMCDSNVGSSGTSEY
jgi:hypothetical protein